MGLGVVFVGEGEQVAHLPSAFGLDVHQHHSGFLVVVAGLVDGFQSPECRLDQLARVVGRGDERQGAALTVVGFIFAERTGADVDVDGLRHAALFAQLFSSTAHVAGDGLLEFVQFGDGAAKAAAADDLLFGWGDVFQAQAGDAAQFENGALHNDREFALHGLGVGLFQIKYVVNAQAVELFGQLASNAPDFVDGNAGHQFVDAGFRQACKVTHATPLRAFLCDVVGEFGLGLGMTDTDTGGNANPLFHLVANRLAELAAVDGHAAQIEKAFVDGVDLLLGGKGAEDAHHAVAHVRIEFVIRRKGFEAVLLFHVANLEPGLPHADAERLGFLRACHGAAVVVGEHHNRYTFESGVEHPFAGNVEVIAIHQGVDAFGHGGGVHG